MIYTTIFFFWVVAVCHCGVTIGNPREWMMDIFSVCIQCTELMAERCTSSSALTSSVCTDCVCTKYMLSTAVQYTAVLVGFVFCVLDRKSLLLYTQGSFYRHTAVHRVKMMWDFVDLEDLNPLFFRCHCCCKGTAVCAGQQCTFVFHPPKTNYKIHIALLFTS